jgi:hypothetical protein
MPPQRPDYQAIAHLPSSERVERFRAVLLEDRRNGLCHPPEHYVQDVPEPERARLLDELRNVQSHLEDEPTTNADSSIQESPAPQRIGRYQTQRLLGRGSFGEVWQAFDPDLQRAVAVKVLRPDRRWSSEQVQQFLEEGRKLARLNHPGIVAVYDVGQHGDSLFIVSELIGGGTLQERMRQGRLPRREALLLVSELADAAHHAHLQGLIHRDVKPANVLLDERQRPHLTDFGVALTEDEQPATRGTVAGTVAYMSPEQIRGESHLLDGRTDTYSLGVVLYELLTGRRPFQGKDRDDYREQIIFREPRPLRAIDDSIPREVEAICLRCLAKAIADRYRTAADLANDLRREAGRPAAPAAQEPARAEARRVPASRSPRMIVGLGVALLACCGVLAALAASGRVWPGRSAAPSVAEQQQPTPKAGSTADDKDVLRVKALVWPDKQKSAISTWDVVGSPNSLKVYTDAISLLQLAVATQDDFEASVEFSQLGQTGRIGVFFGYREDQQKGTASYQLLKVDLGQGQAWLLRATRTVELDTRVETTPRGTLRAVKVEYSGAQQNTLLIRVRRTQLQEVIFNGKSIADLTNGVPPEHDCRGAFGVYNLKSDGVFSKVVIDGARKKVARAGDG